MLDTKLITIGSDIEFFLRDTKTKKFVSSVGLVKGSKDAPHELEKAGCCTQLDNVATEINVPPTDLNGEAEMWANIQYVKDFINNSHGGNLEIVCCGSHSFDPEQLNTEEAQTFGCDPDYNAWKNGEPNPKPQAEDPNLRSTAAHFHIGHPELQAEDALLIAKYLDITLGVPSVVIDSDKERRKLYGKAGSLRFKYLDGVNIMEYRVLSSCFAESFEHIKFVFDGIRKALDFYNNQAVHPDNYKNTILAAINASSIPHAYEIIRDYQLTIPESLHNEEYKKFLGELQPRNRRNTAKQASHGIYEQLHGKIRFNKTTNASTEYIEVPNEAKSETKTDTKIDLSATKSEPIYYNSDGTLISEDQLDTLIMSEIKKAVNIEFDGKSKDLPW